MKIDFIKRKIIFVSALFSRKLDEDFEFNRLCH